MISWLMYLWIILIIIRVIKDNSYIFETFEKVWSFFIAMEYEIINAWIEMCS